MIKIAAAIAVLFVLLCRCGTCQSLALFTYSDGDKEMTQLVNLKSESVLQTTNSVIYGYGRSKNKVGLIGRASDSDIFIACYNIKTFRPGTYQLFQETRPIVIHNYPSELLSFPTEDDCCFTALTQGENAYKIFDLSIDTGKFRKIELPDGRAPAIPIRVGDADLGCASGGKLFRYSDNRLSFITRFHSNNFTPMRLLYVDHYGLVGANFEKRTLGKLSNADATSETESQPMRLNFNPLNMTTVLGETSPSIYFESTESDSSTTVFSKINLLTGVNDFISSCPEKILDFSANNDGGIIAITSDLKSILKWDQKSGWNLRPVKAIPGWRLQSVKFIKPDYS